MALELPPLNINAKEKNPITPPYNIERETRNQLLSGDVSDKPLVWVRGGPDLSF